MAFAVAQILGFINSQDNTSFNLTAFVFVTLELFYIAFDIRPTSLNLPALFVI